MRFYNWELAIVFLAAVPIIIELYKRFFKPTVIYYSDISKLKKFKPKIERRKILISIRILAIILIALALMRPQFGREKQKLMSEGIDIMLALDISGSMKAEDFKPKNRLYVAKKVISDFIKGQGNNRIGLITFAGLSFTQCPLTLDYGMLLEFLSKVTFAPPDWDGTAIGNAVAHCVKRLKGSKAKSKVIILLTDGVNNKGEIDPETAAKLAKAENITLYTIGVGKRGLVYMPVDHPILGRRYVRVQSEIDEVTLKRMARIANGEFFRATDKESLEKIYKNIAKKEKSKIFTTRYKIYKELFHIFLLPALLLLIGEIILKGTIFRKIP